MSKTSDIHPLANLVEEYDPGVKSLGLQAGPVEELLHLPHHHALHGGVLRQEHLQQVYHLFERLVDWSARWLVGWLHEGVDRWDSGCFNNRMASAVGVSVICLIGSFIGWFRVGALVDWFMGGFGLVCGLIRESAGVLNCWLCEWVGEVVIDWRLQQVYASITSSIG